VTPLFWGVIFVWGVLELGLNGIFLGLNGIDFFGFFGFQ
jgi:hypothetical protein